MEGAGLVRGRLSLDQTRADAMIYGFVILLSVLITSVANAAESGMASTIPPETRIRTAIGRPAGLRCAITGSRPLTNPFHAEPASA